MVQLCLQTIDNLLYSSKMLDRLYSRVHSIFTKIDKVRLTKLEEQLYKLDRTPDFSIRFFSEFRDTHFCSREIVSNMEKEVKTITLYRFKYNNNVINLYLYGNEYPIESILVKLTKCFILMELTQIRDIERDIYFYPSKYKKELRLGYDLSPKHVNSGFTNFIGNVGSSIYIFREEDSDKVFLHECIHSLGLDFATSYSIDLDKFILANTLVNSNVNLAESYTDLYAILINSLVDSCYSSVDYREIIATEVLWQKKVVYHILRHMDFSSTDQLFIRKGSGRVFIQTTSVFSYYIVKLVLFSNLEYFLKQYPIGLEWTVDKQWDYYEDILKNIDMVKNIPVHSFKKDKYSIRMVYNKLKINNC